MVEEYPGHPENPETLVKQAFEKIAQTEEMTTLPFYHKGIEVKTIAFQEYEEQWVGMVLTPWMMSIFILPGPKQIWPKRKVGERIGLRFPKGEIAFLVSEIDEIGQYMACSVMSPLDRHTGQFLYEQLAQDGIKELLGQKEPDPDGPENIKRRLIMLKSD